MRENAVLEMNSNIDRKYIGNGKDEEDAEYDEEDREYLGSFRSRVEDSISHCRCGYGDEINGLGDSPTFFLCVVSTCTEIKEKYEENLCNRKPVSSKDLGSSNSKDAEESGFEGREVRGVIQCVANFPHIIRHCSRCKLEAKVSTLISEKENYELPSVNLQLRGEIGRGRGREFIKKVEKKKSRCNGTPFKSR